MRVFKSPRFAKFYDEDSDLVAALGDEHPRWDLLTRIPKKLIKEDKNDEPVWSAGVDPLLNLIRIADLNKGEEPNVEVVQREGLFVIALGNQGGGEVAIKAGESLLRAGDGGEGRVGAGKGDGFEGRVGVGKGDGGEGRVGVGAGMGDEGEEKPELEKTDEEEAWYVAWLDEMMHDRAGEEEDVVLSFFTCG